MWNQKYVSVFVTVLAVFGLYLLWLWQPERQVRLHTSHLVEKVQQRNWEAVSEFLATDYRDRWDHDKASAVADAQEAFRPFLFLTLESRITACEVLEGSATVQATLKVSGNAGPGADMVMERVNTLREPFTFVWKKGNRPWAWQLTSVDQTELNIRKFGGF